MGTEHKNSHEIFKRDLIGFVFNYFINVRMGIIKKVDKDMISKVKNHPTSSPLSLAKHVKSL